jgi:hypothetical protein
MNVLIPSSHPFFFPSSLSQILIVIKYRHRVWSGEIMVKKEDVLSWSYDFTKNSDQEKILLGIRKCLQIRDEH